jgi:hypothetical protein
MAGRQINMELSAEQAIALLAAKRIPQDLKDRAIACFNQGFQAKR